MSTTLAEGGTQVKIPFNQQKPLTPNPALYRNVLQNLVPAINLTGGNVFQLLSSLSPFYLSVFFVLSSISNGDLKWTMYLAGLIFMVFIFALAAYTTNATFDKDHNSDFFKRE
jgi:hypothetical protein